MMHMRKKKPIGMGELVGLIRGLEKRSQNLERDSDSHVSSVSPEVSPTSPWAGVTPPKGHQMKK